MYSQFMMHSQKNIKLLQTSLDGNRGSGRDTEDVEYF